MKARVSAALFALVLAIGVLLVSRADATDETPTQSFCQTWNFLSGLYLPSWEAPITQGMGCGLQPGDVFTDGPLYNPAFTSESGTSFTIPANTWIAQGQRVVTQANPTSAPSSGTTYEWLDCNGCVGESYGTWESSSSSSPPHSYSTLMYIVGTSGGGIVSVTTTTPQTMLASGSLGIQAVDNGTGGYTTNITALTASPMIFTNPFGPILIGTTPFQFIESSSGCSDTSSADLMQWTNGSLNHPLVIGCSTAATALTPAVSVYGRSSFYGPIGNTYLPTPGPSPSPSVEPICGAGNAGTSNSGAYYNWCPNGLQLAMLFQSNTGASATGTGTATFANLYDTGQTSGQCLGLGIAYQILSESYCITSISTSGGWLSVSTVSGAATISDSYTPAPLATSAPVSITNSFSPGTSSPAWLFQDTSANCKSGGGAATNDIIEFESDNADVVDFECNGAVVFAGPVTAASFTNVKNTGFGTGTVSPVCASTTTNEAPCNISQTAMCGSIDPTTGQHVECGQVQNSSFTCSASSVCTIGTFTFTTAFSNTNYQCTATQYGSGTVYANRVMTIGMGAKSSSSSITVVGATPSAVSSITVNVGVICTE